MGNKHYMYVVQCRDSTYYTGYTTNVEKRLSMHNNGTGAKYTRARRPVSLLYVEEYETKSEALKAEYRFKQRKRKQKEDYIRESRNEDVATKELSEE
jgi:putative endonuclease